MKILSAAEVDAALDDLALIEWTFGWSNIGTGYTEIPSPNESTYMQIRSDQEVTQAMLTYELTEREVH